jgi:hypothetical protein
MKCNENYLLCKGAGTLWIHPNTGDVIWASVQSSNDTWCRQNKYKKLEYLEECLGLDPQSVTYRVCEECPVSEECRFDLEDYTCKPDYWCTKVDVGATATAILAALAILSPRTRSKIISSEE